MRTATEWFDKYGESHQNKINKAIHWVAIPTITLTTLGLFQSIPHPFGEQLWLNWATLAVLGAVAFYARISPTIAVGMAVLAGGMVAFNTWLVSMGAPLLPLSIGVFFAAWVFQFVGHKIEGEKPSFFEDLQFLLIGPAWLLQFIYKKVGVPVELDAISRRAA